MSLFNKNLKKGDLVEKFLSEYIEEVFEWKFIGGNIDGKIVNKDEIETLFSCKYIPPKNKIHGHLLRIGSENFLMPDLLFKSQRNIFFWAESKSSYNENLKYVDLEKDKFDSYLRLHRKTKNPVWIIFTTVTEKSYSMYSARVQEISEFIETEDIYPVENPYFGGKLCYSFDLHDNPFRHIETVDK